MSPFDLLHAGTIFTFAVHFHARACTVCAVSLPPNVAAFDLLMQGEKIATCCERCARSYRIETDR